MGISARTGAEVAVTEINRVGGYLGRPLELVLGDDKANNDGVRRCRPTAATVAGPSCQPKAQLLSMCAVSPLRVYLKTSRAWKALGPTSLPLHCRHREGCTERRSMSRLLDFLRASVRRELQWAETITAQAYPPFAPTTLATLLRKRDFLDTIPLQRVPEE